MLAESSPGSDDSSADYTTYHGFGWGGGGGWEGGSYFTGGIGETMFFILKETVEEKMYLLYVSRASQCVHLHDDWRQTSALKTEAVRFSYQTTRCHNQEQAMSELQFWCYANQNVVLKCRFLRKMVSTAHEDGSWRTLRNNDTYQQVHGVTCQGSCHLNCVTWRDRWHGANDFSRRSGGAVPRFLNLAPGVHNRQ
jgi:hypothetical protein